MVPPGSWCPKQTEYSAYRERRYWFLSSTISFISHRPDRNGTLASDLKGAEASSPPAPPCTPLVLDMCIFLPDSDKMAFSLEKATLWLEDSYFARSNTLKLKRLINRLLVDYCDVFISVWTLILTEPIHYRGSVGDVMLNFSKSVPMKKKTNLHLGWLEGGVNFKQIFILSDLFLWDKTPQMNRLIK